MKTRLLRIIWTISLCWLLLIIYGGTFGTAQGQLFINLLAIGWPAFVGLLVCFLFTGSFFWPTELKNESAQSTFIKSPPEFDEPPKTEDPEAIFLESVKKSKALVASQLENARLKLETQWNEEHGRELEKIEQMTRLVKKSNVIECCLRLASETFHWNSWTHNQKGRWNHPSWLADRLLTIDIEKGSPRKLETFSSILGTTYVESETSLETAFGFKDGNDEIKQFIYSTGSFDASKFGRLLVEVNGTLVLDAPITNRVEDEYSDWHYYSQDLNVVKPGSWITSVVNLYEEFQGQKEIERTQHKLAAQQFTIQKNS